MPETERRESNTYVFHTGVRIFKAQTEEKTPSVCALKMKQAMHTINGAPLVNLPVQSEGFALTQSSHKAIRYVYWYDFIFIFNCHTWFRLIKI